MKKIIEWLEAKKYNLRSDLNFAPYSVYADLLDWIEDDYSLSKLIDHINWQINFNSEQLLEYHDDDSSTFKTYYSSKIEEYKSILIFLQSNIDLDSEVKWLKQKSFENDHTKLFEFVEKEIKLAEFLYFKHRKKDQIDAEYFDGKRTAYKDIFEFLRNYVSNADIYLNETNIVLKYHKIS